MARRVVLKGIMLSLVVILALVLVGCVKFHEYPGGESYSEEIMIGIDGGVVTAMEGNVVITIPPGALTESVRFVVHDRLNKSAVPFPLNVIVIDPFVEFKEPVQLTLKYDGCLGTGADLCDASSVSFLVWNNEAAFINQLTPLTCASCNVNGELRTVCNCIARTGVIAVQAVW